MNSGSRSTLSRLRPWLWLLLLVPLVLGILRLRFDVEILNLLPGELSVAQGLKVYQKHFSDARELIITVEAPGADETEAGALALASVLRAETNRVARVTWRPAWLEEPAQARELMASLWFNQPPEQVSALVRRLDPANLTNVLREAREELATSFSPSALGFLGYDPYGLMRLPESATAGTPSFSNGDELFASSDGTFRLMFVEARPDLSSYKACRDWLAGIREVVARAQADGRLASSVKLRYTGRPAFVTEIAGGMEGDMTGSIGGTLVTIGVLFWLTHRRLRPLGWLLVMLLGILAASTAMGGLFLGTINVVSMGFASILLGLAEDFGIVIYQELRSHPELDARGLRRETAPGIVWSAITTAGAFFLLNLSTLPGLGQLGSLVAIGILLAAFLMLYGYLPVLLRLRRDRDRGSVAAAATDGSGGAEDAGKAAVPADGAGEERYLLFSARKARGLRHPWLVTVGLLAVAVGLVAWKGVRFDPSPNVLKPRNSEANAALEQIKARFGRTHEPLWVLIPGKTEGVVARRLAEVDAVLQRAVSNGWIAGFTLPTALWPRPEHQAANRAAFAGLVANRELLAARAVEAGFTRESFALTAGMLDHWDRAVRGTNVFWPTNDASRWIYSKIVARTDDGFLALGPVHPVAGVAGVRALLAAWPPSLGEAGVVLSGWELLGATVFQTVVSELPRVILPIFLLVVVSLWLAFRNLRELWWSLLTLAFSAVLLAGCMAALGWSWNILNLMALPLLLGMGVDFGIHMQLGLRRHGGDERRVRQSVGRALLLAGATTVAGFASLAFSTNAGMASLGQVCALGIALALVVAVYLLPGWWRTGRRPGAD